MARKKIVFIAVSVALAVSLSSLVAYRLGLRRSGWAVGPARAAKGGCVEFGEARSHLGETGCVSGRVLRTFTSRSGNSFLDFCPDYRNCSFSAVIFASDRTKFGDLGTLEGRQVEIDGPIVDYNGRAEIKIHDPQQIRVLP